MAKFEVTEELSQLIRTTKSEKKVSSKALAEYLGKSPSYISKLENGAVKYIEDTELKNIFAFIFGNKETGETFLEENLSEIYDKLSVNYDNKVIDKQMWLYNFDTVYRLIPIPEELRLSLNELVKKLGVSVEYLCARINSNELINPKVKNKDKYPFNEWQPYVENGEIEFYFIKLDIGLDVIEGILDGSIKKTTYFIVNAIAYYLFRMTLFPSVDFLSDEQESELENKTTDYLTEQKFYTLQIRNELLEKNRTSQSNMDYLSDFDKKNAKLIHEMLIQIKKISDVDIDATNKRLQVFIDNLNKDPGFMLRIMSLDYKELDMMSFTTKKQMIKDIEETISKYDNLSDVQKEIEIY